MSGDAAAVAGDRGQTGGIGGTGGAGGNGGNGSWVLGMAEPAGWGWRGAPVVRGGSGATGVAGTDEAHRRHWRRRWCDGAVGGPAV